MRYIIIPIFAILYLYYSYKIIKSWIRYGIDDTVMEYEYIGLLWFIIHVIGIVILSINYW